MLWVGGHIFLISLDEIGGTDGLLEGTALGDVLHAPYDLVHHWEEEVHARAGLGPRRLAGWLVNTLALRHSSASSSAAIVVAVLRAFGTAATAAGHDAGHDARHDAGPRGRGARRGFSESVSPVLRF